VFSVQRIAAAIALMAGLFFLTPAEAKTACRHDARDCRAMHHTAMHHMGRHSDWYLHRPSTPRERAETRALNHQELAATIMPAPVRGYDSSQSPYQRDLRAYRQAQQRYEMDMRRYAAGPRDFRDARDGRDFRDERSRRGRRDFSRAPRRQAKWPEELDNDPCAPTGGQADPNIAAPTNLDGAVTGLTQFNARASGLRKSCEPSRRR
jgi:hypothetical protein